MFYNEKGKETYERRINIEKERKMWVLMCSSVNIIIGAPKGVGLQSG